VTLTTPTFAGNLCTMANACYCQYFKQSWYSKLFITYSAVNANSQTL